MKRLSIVVLPAMLFVALTACELGASSEGSPSNLNSNSEQIQSPAGSPPATPAQLGEPVPAVPLNDRVLVIYNTRSAASQEVAGYYARRRSIPLSHRTGIAFPSRTTLDWSVYLSTVQPAIRKAIDAVGRHKLLYIVMTYETPWLMLGAPVPATSVNGSGRGSNLVDAFVADIFDQLNQTAFNNPYYSGSQSKANLYVPFQTFAYYRTGAEAKEIFQVWRVDGPSAALAKGLVDKALQAENGGPLAGRGYFDNRNLLNGLTAEDMSYAAGDWDIYRAAEFTQLMGFPVVRDENEEEFGTAPAPPACPEALFYAGWYSLDNYNDVFTWKPGAIGLHLDSASAKDLRGGANWAANAIIRGITVTAGSTAEPFLEHLPHPDGVFRDTFAGANVGDAFYRNTATLRWVVMFIGDPLYRPFPGGRPSPGVRRGRVSPSVP